MNRKLQEPLTLPVHPELLEEINDKIIAIKLHHTIKPEDQAEGERILEASKLHQKPSWEEMTDLLRRAYNAINKQRKDPRRY